MFSENICKVIEDAVHLYKETFFRAKQMCDSMNTNLDGRITQDDFRAFCQQQPSAMDFICRLTIGPYPPTDES